MKIRSPGHSPGRRRAVAALLATALLALPLAALAQGPASTTLPPTPPASGAAPQGQTALEQLRRHTERGLEVLNDRRLSQAQREQEIARLARTIFDEEEAARRALGRHWQARSPQERAEFVQLFVELLQKTYLHRLSGYKGERVRWVEQVVDGQTAVVRARVVLTNGREVPVEVRMIQRDDRWGAYDVLIEGVSLINNYRTQFDQIIQRSGYPELVKRLKSRTA